jgi:WD repeat-containing protein 42A
MGEIQEGGTVETRQLAKHRGRAHKLAVDPLSPHLLLSTGEDGKVLEIDTRSPAVSELVRVTRPNGRVVALNCISLSPASSNLFCVGGGDSFCRVFDRRMTVTGDEEGARVREVAKLCPTHLREGPALRLGLSITCTAYSYPPPTTSNLK